MQQFVPSCSTTDYRRLSLTLFRPEPARVLYSTPQYSPSLPLDSLNASLLNDRASMQAYKDLFELRSTFFHGRAGLQKVSTAQRVTARGLVDVASLGRSFHVVRAQEPDPTRQSGDGAFRLLDTRRVEVEESEGGLLKGGGRGVEREAVVGA